MELTKESELYNEFVQALINKVKSGAAEVKDLALVKEFMRENNIGANPKTHEGLTELGNTPFPEDDNDPVITNTTLKVVN